MKEEITREEIITQTIKDIKDVLYKVESCDVIIKQRHFEVKVVDIDTKVKKFPRREVLTKKRAEDKI